ncbi:MAG: phage portal protein [Clostridium sp.]|uniref:phage portal protein n=1 Tax=Clostridium sp. TaxID=1506 RepID=UPI003F39C306
MNFIQSLFNNTKQQEERSYNTFLQGGSMPIFTNESNKNIYLEKIPSLKKGNDLLCGTISSLPIKLIQEKEDVKEINDYRLKFLNDEANLITTSSAFKSAMLHDLLFEGKAYAVIERKGNKVCGLHHVKHQSTQFYLDNNGFPLCQEITYILHGNTYTKEDNQMLIIENSNGGILNKSRSLLNDVIEEYETYKQLTENCAMPLGVLKTEGRLNETAIERLRTAWNNLYTGRRNAGKTMILENGLDYMPISKDLSIINMEEKEKVIGGKIEDVLGLPKGYLTSSNTHQDTEILLSQTLNTLIVAIEEGLSKALLLEEEKENGYKFIIDTRELNKSNDKEYQENLTQLFNNGIITLKESRKMLNLSTNNIDRDLKLLSLGSVIQYQDNNEVFVPNMAMSINQNEKSNLKNKNQNQNENQNLNLKSENKNIKSNFKSNQKENNFEN